MGISQFFTFVGILVGFITISWMVAMDPTVSRMAHSGINDLLYERSPFSCVSPGKEMSRTLCSKLS